MGAIMKLFSLILICFSALSVYGTCPFKYRDVVTACLGENDYGIVYPAGTSNKEVESFPLRKSKRSSKGYTHGIGCVDETPSPAWFAIKIDEPGDLLMKISHSEGSDIDFVCWGPFYGDTKQAMLENICANSDKFFEDHMVPHIDNDCKLTQLDQCESRFAVSSSASAYDVIQSKNNISDCKSKVELRSETDIKYECFYGNNDSYPLNYMVDCSFTDKETEKCFISNAKKDEWYIILVTNFYAKPGNITFTKLDGKVTTDCSVILDAGSNSPVCEGDTLSLFINNLPAYATCKWTGPNGFESKEVNPKIKNVSKAYEGVYYVQVTTHDGLKSDEIPVLVNILKNTPVDTTIRLVKGTETKFKNVTFTKAGKYEVPVKSGDCTKIFNVTVVEVPLLPAYIEQNGPICEGDSLMLSIGNAPTSGVQGYEWSGPNGFRSTSKNPVVSKMNSKKAGKYSLKIKKDDLVYPVAPVEVEVAPKIKEVIVQHIEYGESFEFNGESISQRGVYSATYESSLGCDSMVELHVVLDMPEPEPDDHISPNGDGINDVWYIKNIDLYPEAIVHLYDRYGKLVYETTEYGDGNFWDGNANNGNPLPSTDYWYVIDVPSIDKIVYGHVTLLR